MAAIRWEKERAAWLLAHSRPGTGRRRRAELLRRTARKAARSESGVAESGLHEDVTPPLFRRMITTDEGAGEQLARLIAVPLLFGAIGLVVGPALALAAVGYAALWYFAPRIGRLWSWPWIVGGGVLLVSGGWLISALGTGTGAWFEMPSGLHVYPPVALPVWLWAQVSIALIFIGAQIVSCGWAAVKPGSARSKVAVPKNKDGSFKRIADEDLVALVPFGDNQTPAEEPQAKPEEDATENTAVDEDEEADLDDDDLELIEIDEPEGDVEDTKKETDHV